MVLLGLEQRLLVLDFDVQLRRLEDERFGAAVVHPVVVVDAIVKCNDVGVIHVGGYRVLVRSSEATGQPAAGGSISGTSGSMVLTSMVSRATSRS